jgi:CDP-diacylglycerol--glycerol-3-phosphate 3-phosphatidyltransferase
MNLPNKITLGRIILSILILIIMVFPFYNVGYEFPKYLVMGKVLVDSKYMICGVLFIIASVTDFIDGRIARSRNMVTDFGKVMDAIADKILVNGVLIIMAVDGVIPVIIPVIIITRDTAVDCVKMIAGSKGNVVAASIWGKIKTMCMMCGISLLFFANLPFELINVSLGYYLVIIATLFSIYSGVQYFSANKEFIFSDK